MLTHDASKSPGMIKGLDPLSILQKKFTVAQSSAPTAAPAEKELAPPQEKLNLSVVKKGTAQLSLTDDLQAMQQNWVKAGKAGNPVKDIQNAVRNGQSPATAIYKYMKAQGYSKQEMNNVAKFLENVMKHGKVESSRNSNLTGRNLMDVISDGIKDKGISDKQLKMLAQGDFSFAAYTGMVKDGQSIV